MEVEKYKIMLLFNIQLLRFKYFLSLYYKKTKFVTKMLTFWRLIPGENSDIYVCVCMFCIMKQRGRSFMFNELLEFLEMNQWKTESPHTQIAQTFVVVWQTSGM